MTPDLICVLDTVSGEAIGTETLRYGQRVTVIALPAPPVLLTPKGLEHVGPRAFGYDLEFVSLFTSEGGVRSEGGFAPLPNLPPGLRGRSPRSDAV
jgi:hypothetical protein